MSRRSAWQVGTTIPKFAPLDRDLAVDVAVVGGGLIGTAIAWRLAQAGSSVVLVVGERAVAASGVAAGMLARSPRPPSPSNRCWRSAWPRTGVTRTS